MQGPSAFNKRLASFSFKKRWDHFQENDNVSGCGDQVGDFSEQGNISLTGSPKGVKFIMKDETNAEAMKKMKMRAWWDGKW